MPVDIVKGFVMNDFLQMGTADPSVYFVPTCESQGMFGWFRLLLAASYGLLNANFKFEVQSDNLQLQIRSLRVI